MAECIVAQAMIRNDVSLLIPHLSECLGKLNASGGVLAA